MAFAWPVTATLFMLTVTYVESKGSGTVKPLKLYNCTVKNSISLGSEVFVNAVLLCNGSYNSILCDNHWTTADAKVACRSLGKSVEGAIPDRFNQTATHYVSSEYVPHCNGTEEQLSDCKWVIRPNSGQPCDFYVGVICPDPSESVSVVSSTVVQSSLMPTSSITLSPSLPSRALSASASVGITETEPEPTVKDSTSSFGAGPIVGVITAANVVAAIVAITMTILMFWLIRRNRVKHLALTEPMYEEIDPPVHAATSIATPTPSPPLGTSGVEVELQENQCYGPFQHRQVELLENPCYGPKPIMN